MRHRCLALVYVLVISFLSVRAQEAADRGSGGFDFSEIEGPMSEQMRQSIITLLDNNIRMLQSAGKGATGSADSVRLTWPLATSLPDFGYHGISNFVDHNPEYPDKYQDYNCGMRTYDRETGYNHQGVDFFLWPYAWHKMDQDQVQVVAAAPGTIILKQDGNFDRNCSYNDEAWNAVYVQHDDSSVAWYGHLKAGSLTSKEIGERVERGEYLGIVGSSGNSTGPHLHFEVYDARNNLIDPFEGPCNRLNPTSWWEDQTPYYDSAVNLITTGTVEYETPTCPDNRVPDSQTVFDPGSLIYFTVFYRDQLAGQESRYTIFRPDGSIYLFWSDALTVPHYSASWWWWAFPFDPAEQEGEWTFQVEYEEKIYTHHFVITPVSTGTEDFERLPGGYRVTSAHPNPFFSSTRFTLEVDRSQQVRVEVYDMLGRLVKVLHDGLLAGGELHVFEFEAGQLPSGSYLVEVTGDSFSDVQLLTAIK